MRVGSLLPVWQRKQHPVQAGGCSSGRRKLETADGSRRKSKAVEPAELKDQRQVRVGSWSPDLPEEGRQRKLEGQPKVGRKRGAADESRRFSHRSSRTTEHRSEPEKLAASRAGPGAIGESRRFLKPAQPEERAAAQAAGSPLGELGDATAGCATSYQD